MIGSIGKKLAGAILLGVSIIALHIILADPALAEPAKPPLHTSADNTLMANAGAALLMLLMLALVVENALAPLFKWRVFHARFSGRGAKMPITLIVSLFLVFTTQPDTLVRLYNAYNAPLSLKEGSEFVLRILEALVIAGGSAGVFRLMVALGLRSEADRSDELPRPKPTEGWISVAHLRRDAVGSVNVEIDEGNGFQLAGTITEGRTGTKARRRSAGRLILRNDDCFPASGGLAIPSGTATSVRLSGKDQSGSDISALWGPNVVRGGAIIDIDLVL